MAKFTDSKISYKSALSSISASIKKAATDDTYDKRYNKRYVAPPANVDVPYHDRELARELAAEAAEKRMNKNPGDDNETTHAIETTNTPVQPVSPSQNNKSHEQPHQLDQDSKSKLHQYNNTNDKIRRLLIRIRMSTERKNRNSHGWTKSNEKQLQEMKTKAMKALQSKYYELPNIDHWTLDQLIDYNTEIDRIAEIERKKKNRICRQNNAPSHKQRNPFASRSILGGPVLYKVLSEQHIEELEQYKTEGISTQTQNLISAAQSIISQSVQDTPTETSTDIAIAAANIAIRATDIKVVNNVSKTIVHAMTNTAAVVASQTSDDSTTDYAVAITMEASVDIEDNKPNKCNNKSTRTTPKTPTHNRTLRLKRVCPTENPIQIATDRGKNATHMIDQLRTRCKSALDKSTKVSRPIIDELLIKLERVSQIFDDTIQPLINEAAADATTVATNALNTASEITHDAAAEAKAKATNTLNTAVEITRDAAAEAKAKATNTLNTAVENTRDAATYTAAEIAIRYDHAMQSLNRIGHDIANELQYYLSESIERLPDRDEIIDLFKDLFKDLMKIIYYLCALILKLFGIVIIRILPAAGVGVGVVANSVWKSAVHCGKQYAIPAVKSVFKRGITLYSNTVRDIQHMRPAAGELAHLCGNTIRGGVFQGVGIIGAIVLGGYQLSSQHGPRLVRAATSILSYSTQIAISNTRIYSMFGSSGSNGSAFGSHRSVGRSSDPPPNDDDADSEDSDSDDDDDDESLPPTRAVTRSQTKFTTRRKGYHRTGKGNFFRLLKGLGGGTICRSRKHTNKKHRKVRKQTKNKKFQYKPFFTRHKCRKKRTVKR